MTQSKQATLLTGGRLLAQRLQLRAIKSLEHDDLEDGFDDVEACMLVCTMLLLQAPSDVEIRLQLGMAYKTQSQLHEARGDAAQAADALHDAERLFEFVANELPAESKTASDAANALHGIGTVQQARNQLDRAIESYRLALRLEPRHVYALHDILAALFQKADAGKVDPNAMASSLARLQSEVGAFVARNGQHPQGITAAYLARLQASVNGWREQGAGADLSPLEARAKEKAGGFD